MGDLRVGIRDVLSGHMPSPGLLVDGLTYYHLSAGHITCLILLRKLGDHS